MNTRDVFVLSLCSKKLAISVQNCKSAQQYMTQMCYKTFVRHQHQFVIENEYVLLLVPDLILKAGLWFWCKDFELEGVRFR